MPASAPSQRQLRVGELVRHALTEVLQRDPPADPALDGVVISVSEVRMSPDLKIATCFVSPLGGGDGQAVVKGLARNARYLRGRTAPLLSQMKFMPSFRFLEDTSFDAFSRIDALLKSDRVSRDLDADDS